MYFIYVFVYLTPVKLVSEVAYAPFLVMTYVTRARVNSIHIDIF